MTATRARRRVGPVPPTTAAALGTVGALLIVFVANYHVPHGENGGTWPGVVTGAGCLVVAALIFGALVPRFGHRDGFVLALAALATVSLLAFWSGVTPVLAAAALAARGDGPRARRCDVARTVAVVAAVVAMGVVLATSHLG